MSSNKKTATTKTNDTNTTPKTNDATTMSNNTTTSMTNNSNSSNNYYVFQTSSNPRPNQKTSSSNCQHRSRRNRYSRRPCSCIKLDNSTYDPREDDDYNVDEGRPLDNFSEENSEWCEKNDFNKYENPGQ
ncbi:4279_t:CDS:2 [Cetraspora pellucida]|uniref:4279_t:CDS:1 n=1 Tax=Cetraspora pellucida TaxID=1433469 RepID=A0ACA9LWX5_9GLOM|nr:4279_t:CDS:2 [Cetraspora pellucida]